MTRDIKGPAPHQFGIIAKFPSQSKNATQYAKNKEFDYKIEQLNHTGKLDTQDKIRINFFDDADRKARNNNVKRNVQEIMNQRNFLLNERRAKLKQMLAQEENNFENEILQNTISPLERAAQLREKAKQIRVAKATENELFVRDKMDQKWRLECDELRTYQSKHLQSGMGVEHMRQIGEKIEREQYRLQEEGVFADMWYQDIEAKNLKEDDKLRKTKERNLQVSAVLKQQMEVLENQKLETKRIKNENAKLLKEKSNIEALEKQLNHQKKRGDQENRRHELDLCVRAKLINEKRRLQKENAFDLQCLEDSIVSFQNEDEERAQRKHELMIEQTHYRRYLQQLHEEEKIREVELNAIIEEDTEKELQKQLQKWKAQKFQRKKLFEETLAGRRIQIEDKMKQNQQKEMELEKEKVRLNKEIEFHKQAELDEWVKSREKIDQYGQDLIGQMNYNTRQNEIYEESKPEEFRKYLKNEEEYASKLNEAMTNLKYVKGKHY